MADQAKTPPGIKPQGFKVRRSPEFKLKDKANRSYIIINLKNFGFLPETIIVRKVHGGTNRFYVEAVVPPEVLKAEEAKKKETKKGGVANGKQPTAQPVTA